MQRQDIADANVERLLEAAYKPEPVDTAFANQIEEAMCAAALVESKTSGVASGAWPGRAHDRRPRFAGCLPGQHVVGL